MSKIYELYSSDQRVIDNLKRKIRGYEKMKKDITSQNRKVNNQNRKLQQENKKYKEVISKAINLLGHYTHYSVPDEKQNSYNEDLVNKVYDILKEVEDK